jgi:hypothetical protein
MATWLLVENAQKAVSLLPIALKMKLYKLLGPDGKLYESRIPGILGGHKRNKGYGRLDCPSALRWVAKGYYVKHRVFFATEAAAIAAGYRPSACCMKERYAVWKQALTKARSREQALRVYGKLLGFS